MRIYLPEKVIHRGRKVDKSLCLPTLKSKAVLLCELLTILNPKVNFTL